MLHVRVIKTKGILNLYRYVTTEKGKRVIFKHIGSGSTEQQITILLEMAKVFIADHTKQIYLFDEQQPNEQDVLLSQCTYLGSYYTFLYDILRAIQHHIGYTLLTDTLLNDLTLIRIIEPASKLRSIRLLQTYFGIHHRRQRYYESSPKWLELKQTVEKQTLKFAKAVYSFDFSMVFYDVTTLYFESFTSDDLRKTGFSKDGKVQQPQILVGLF